MMESFVVLLRGINVGGKNKVPMAELRECLEKLGFSRVSTYIASGNVILRSDKTAGEIKTLIEEVLPKSFKLDSELIKVLVLSQDQLQKVVDKKPKGFGDEPEKFYCDVVFLMGIAASDAIKVFDPRDGIDSVWSSDTVIYSQRLGSQRTKSRLSKIVGTVPYRSMTVRTWNTVTKLLELLKDINEN